MTIYSVPYTSDQQVEMVSDLVEAIDENEATIRMQDRLHELGHTGISIYTGDEIKSPKRVVS